MLIIVVGLLLFLNSNFMFSIRSPDFISSNATLQNINIFDQKKSHTELLSIGSWPTDRIKNFFVLFSKLGRINSSLLMLFCESWISTEIQSCWVT